MEKIYNKILKLGKKWDKGLIKKTIDNINNDPEAGWLFITTILLLGVLGVGLCILWFYFMIKEGMPVWAIIFDTAIVIFCGWAIVKGIIPMSKKAYKLIDEKREKQNSVQESDDVHKK